LREALRDEGLATRHRPTAFHYLTEQFEAGKALEGVISCQQPSRTLQHLCILLLQQQLQHSAPQIRRFADQQALQEGHLIGSQSAAPQGLQRPPSHLGARISEHLEQCLTPLRM
jgi:hypothetical protein